MKRCYKCGIKKQDDKILCEKCVKELEERLKKKKDNKKNVENIIPTSKKLKGLKCDTVIIDEFELPFGKES